MSAPISHWLSGDHTTAEQTDLPVRVSGASPQPPGKSSNTVWDTVRPASASSTSVTVMQQVASCVPSDDQEVQNRRTNLDVRVLVHVEDPGEERPSVRGQVGNPVDARRGRPQWTACVADRH